MPARNWMYPEVAVSIRTAITTTFGNVAHEQGKTEQEALANIKEAITAWLWAEDQKAAEALPEDQAALVVAV